MTAQLPRYTVVYGLLHGSRLKVGGGMASPRFYVFDKATGTPLRAFVDATMAKRRAEYRNGKETPQRSSCEDCGASKQAFITADSVRPLAIGDVVSFVGEDWTIAAGPYALLSGKLGYDLQRAGGTKVKGISATSVKRKD